MAIFKFPHIPLSLNSSIVTVGMFDGVHIGHRHIVGTLIHEAEQRFLRPLVVTFDRHPRSVLGCSGVSQALLCDAGERVERLQALGDIDIVVLPFDKDMSQLSACEFLRQILVARLGCRAILLGYDNSFGSKHRDDFGQLPILADELKISLLRDNPILIDGAPVSSSRIRKTIGAGDMVLTRRLLGHSYGVSGCVFSGRKVGRTIGFPTANVSLAGSGRLLPKVGVYAVHVHRQDENRALLGMCNLGGQPTFGLDDVTLEVNIFDFSESLYEEVVEVSFEWRLRDIVRFDTVDELRAQLQSDQAAIRRWFAANSPYDNV
ncbi:MAG: riboflavin biosynthesis protein RibF [Bacteroidales bacterium]|nr:riboflavin biosynthesis protein RibF [Bacteroidales bacterium]